jgi:ABC-type microcin C transport system permease subunit YejB
MWKYLVRRILGAVPTLFLLITLAFFMIRLAPGGPFDGDKVLPPEIQANLDAKYDLDQPLLVQYVRYLGMIVRGDLGPSFQYSDFTVSELIRQGFPVSLTLGVSALTIALLFRRADRVHRRLASEFPHGLSFDGQCHDGRCNSELRARAVVDPRCSRFTWAGCPRAVGAVALRVT